MDTESLEGISSSPAQLLFHMIQNLYFTVCSLFLHLICLYYSVVPSKTLKVLLCKMKNWFARSQKARNVHWWHFLNGIITLL